MKAPAFWKRDGSPTLRLLAWPLSLFWRAGTLFRNIGGRPQNAAVPVICVGNLDVGGSGKTPTVQMLIRWFADCGQTAGVLSRGYGGALSGPEPVRVKPAEHSADQVGDEPLLHAALAPTVICENRAKGAEMLQSLCDVILMDDGHQNHDLIKDLSLIVVDAHEGFGNGAIVPAGPLRESMSSGLLRANAIVAVGTGLPDPRLQRSGLPVLRARTRATATLDGQRVYGFCGIGRPERFRQTLEGLGADIAGFESFSDHHAFRPAEFDALASRASSLNAVLVTTEKDFVRLSPDQRQAVQTVPVHLEPDQPERLDGLLQPILEMVRKRASDARQPNKSG